MQRAFGRPCETRSTIGKIYILMHLRTSETEKETDISIRISIFPTCVAARHCSSGAARPPCQSPIAPQCTVRPPRAGAPAMEAAVTRWAAEAGRRVGAMEAAHATGRCALEADIATHPLEPQLSRAVADLVGAEDAAGRAGNVRAHGPRARACVALPCGHAGQLVVARAAVGGGGGRRSLPSSVAARAAVGAAGTETAHGGRACGRGDRGGDDIRADVHRGDPRAAARDRQPRACGCGVLVVVVAVVVVCVSVCMCVCVCGGGAVVVVLVEGGRGYGRMTHWRTRARTLSSCAVCGCPNIRACVVAGACVRACVRI